MVGFLCDKCSGHRRHWIHIADQWTQKEKLEMLEYLKSLLFLSWVLIVADMERVKELFQKLYDLTVTQDELQLSIPRPNESVAISLDLINSANALILEASKWKGDIRPQVRYGYTKEKVLSIVQCWNAMAHDYNISHDDIHIPLIEAKLVVPEKEIPKEIRERQHKLIFEGQEKLS